MVTTPKKSIQAHNEELKEMFINSNNNKSFTQSMLIGKHALRVQSCPVLTVLMISGTTEEAQFSDSLPEKDNT